MSATKKILGNNVVVTAKDRSNNNVPIAYARNCEVDADTDFQEKSSASTANWKEFEPKRSWWKMIVQCLLADDESEIMLAFKNRTLLNLSFADDQVNEWSWHGTGYIKKIKATGPMDQMASFVVEFQGTGALEYELI